MKNPAWLFTALVLLICLIALPGCPTAPKTQMASLKQVAKRNDAHQVGIKLLREALDTPRYREGLNLLNTDLQQRPELAAKNALGAEARKFLQDHAALTPEELHEVESPTFRPADAYYLAECFLLRDAARSLEVSGLVPEELARHCFGWVVRHVLLHEQGDEWLPPALVLRRGYGSARDRALVFLALLRQLRVQEQQIEGCLFTLAGAADEVVLVGVLGPLPRGKEDEPPATPRDVYLFDPRLGFAVQTANGKVATLKNVEADPKWLKPSGLSGEQLKAVAVRLACPLSALSPRMGALEKDLIVHDRIALYLDADRLRNDVAKATGRPAHVWSAPAVDGNAANSPTRALRLLLSPDDGGTDKENRFKSFQAERAPWSPVWLALDQIKLGPGQLADPALAYLLRITADLCEKYDQQPHEMLLRGKSEEVVQRFHRARFFLEDEGVGDEADFQKAVAEWRSKANAAYSALGAKDGQGQALVNSLWAEDQFLLVLLQVELEDQPGKFPKQTLTRIAAHGIREYLYQRALWLRAMLWQEKAERDQVLAGRAVAGNKTAAANAHSDWLNTRPAWNLYLDRAAVGPAARRQRLEAIRAQLKLPGEVNAVHAAHLIEGLHLGLTQYCAARMNHAQAVYRLEGAKAAAPLLRSLDEELTVLLDRGKNDSPGLKADVDMVRQRLRAPASAPLVRSLELLQHDWGPQGNYYWLQQRARRQLEIWENT